LKTLTAKEAQKKLRTLADPALAASATRFFKTGPGEYGENDVFIGLRAATLRQLAKDFQKLALEEAKELIQSNVHEDRALALLILVRTVARAPDSVRKQVYDLYLANTRFVNNWDLVDVSAPAVVGGYLADKSRKPLSTLAKSKSLWERRIAIVATQHFIRLSDFGDTLNIAAMMLGDEEDLVHKAVGWMLREVGKRDVPALEGFLGEYYQRMPRTMLRYAIERFPINQRKAYLKGGATNAYKPTQPTTRPHSRRRRKEPAQDDLATGP
jgi:3-methyladenine DNA glycosylase AlkD